MPDSACRRDALAFLAGLRNGSEDALRMFDATGKPGSAILRGNIRALGDWDECVGVARYCLADVQLPAPADVGNATARVLGAATAGRWLFEDIPRRTGPVVLPVFSLVQWGLCVPASCHSEEVTHFVTSFLEIVSGSKLQVVIPPGACSSKLPSLSTSDIVILSAIASIVLLIVLCTFWDLLQTTCQNQTDLEKATHPAAGLVRSMSLCTSWNNLWNFDNSCNSIACIDGIRALSALWVIMTHKILQMSQEPWVNKVALVEAARDFPKMPLLNSMINVDSFFLISGILRSMNFMRDAQHGKLSILSGIMQRLLRLTPAYAVVLAVYACLLPYFGSGPEWNRHVIYNSQTCRKYWFFNLFYLNNYINYENMCMLQSWYLSADMQLFICALIVLVPMFYWRKVGELLLGVIIFISVALPFATVLIRRLPGLYQPAQPDVPLFEYVRDVYMATHNRMTPYLVGLALGYLIHRIGRKPVILNKVFIGIGWILSLLVLGAVVWGPYQLLQYYAEQTTTTLEAAAYAALHRFTWALAVGWIIMACYQNLSFGCIGGAVKKVLESSALKPLSRLSYCIFLTHIAVILVNSARIRTPIFMDEYLLLHNFAGDLAVILPVAVILHLFIEAPSLAIARSIFQNRGKKQNISKDAANQNQIRKRLQPLNEHQKDRYQHRHPVELQSANV